MPSSSEHPSLATPVTESERAVALNKLRMARDAEVLTPSEYDRRAGIAALAVTRRDLNSAFLGIVEVNPWEVREAAAPPKGRGLAVVAYLGSLFLTFLPPLLVFATTSRTPFARREAAKAFNATFAMVVAVTVSAILALALGETMALVAAFVVVGWFFMMLWGAVQAGQGIDWDPPLRRRLRFEVLREH